MGKRSNMAIEKGWPRKVVIKRFQDRVYKMLSERPSLIRSYTFMTPLHSPDTCILHLDMAYSSLINDIKRAKLDVFVAPDSDTLVKVYLIWPSEY